MSGHPTAPLPTIGDSLRVIQTREGKILYDSENDMQRKEPEFELDPTPLKFCLECGGDVLAAIFTCKCCGRQYVKQIEKKSGKKIIMEMSEKHVECVNCHMKNPQGAAFCSRCGVALPKDVDSVETPSI